MSTLNKSGVARLFRRTPMHPQWLMESAALSKAWIRKHACGRVLDVGCADRWIEHALRPGCEYVGLDYPLTGKQLYAARPDIFADASRLPFEDGIFDTVILLEVLEHLRNPGYALAEVARVLRPGGALLLSIPFLYPIHDAPHDYQRFTKYGLAREVEAAGLMPIELVPTLGSAETGGVVLALALGGMLQRSVVERRVSMIMAPLIVGLVLAVNLTCWTVARLLPSWSATTSGYRLHAVRL